MASISVYSKNSFDAAYDSAFYFSYSGSQCVRNRIQVYDNSDTSLVYEDTEDSFALNHIVPGNTLTNGSTYYVVFTAYWLGTEYSYTVGSTGLAAGSYYFTISGASHTFTLDDALVEDDILTFDTSTSLLKVKHYSTSTEENIPVITGTTGTLLTFTRQYGSITSSASTPFLCLTTPVWGFSNLNTGDTINNSSYTLQVTYSQAQGELLDRWEVYVYTISGTAFYTSEIRYDSDMSDTVAGLEDGKQYAFRVVGQTVHGFELDTRTAGVDIIANVDYTTPELFSVVNVENLPTQGSIKVSSNVAAIDGTPSVEPVTYISDMYVDLRGNDATVAFSGSYDLPDDHIVEITTYDNRINRALFSVVREWGIIQVFYRKNQFDDGMKFYAELRQRLDGLDNSLYSVTLSNMIDVPAHNEIIHLWIKRVDGYYTITITNMGVPD